MNQPLVSERFPYLPVAVRLSGEPIRVQAIVDTGFSGAFVLPERYVDLAGLQITYRNWRLADGSNVDAPTIDGFVQVGNFPEVQVKVTVLGNQPILGLEVLRHYAVLFDHGERVIVIES